MELIFNVAVHFILVIWNHQTMMLLNTQIASTRVQNTFLSLSHCENIHEWIESSWMDNYGILLLLLPPPSSSGGCCFWLWLMILGMWQIYIIPYWLKLAQTQKQKDNYHSLSLSLSVGSTLWSLWHTPPPKCLNVPRFPPNNSILNPLEWTSLYSHDKLST
jgi:hypothetical protein